MVYYLKYFLLVYKNVLFNIQNTKCLLKNSFIPTKVTDIVQKGQNFDG